MIETLAAAFRRAWAAMKGCWNAPKVCFQHQWLVGKEIGAVIFATRVPTLVVALVFVLLSCTEPAQDMLSEAALDVFETSPTTLPFFQWYRLVAIVGTLVFLAASAWYWSRVALMYHRAMPDLVANDEGRFRSTWRPALVMWWPRLLGTAVFVGCVLGLVGALSQYMDLKAQAQSIWLGVAALAVAGLGGVFLRFLIVRRRRIPQSGSSWELAGEPDGRAPYQRVFDIIDAEKGAAPGMTRVGRAFLAITLLGTPLLLLFAGRWPVTLGDGLGGLAVAQLAAAIAIPWFTLVTIAGATNRLPYFGLAALAVLAVPTFNSWIFARIDNHDVRTIAGVGLPERWTIDQVYDAWFDEKYRATKILYSSICQEREGHRLGECRSAAELDACGKNRECRLWRERPPFIVIAAEGGASRAGYWTALSVGEMLRQDPDMRDSIFAISSVSGGTLGAVLIRALIDLDRLQEKTGKLPPDKRVTCRSGEEHPKPYLSCARVFMRRDFLASAFAGMFYTDLLQRFIPSGILPLPDRAETIERSWEESWNDVVDKLLDADDALKDRLRGLFGKGFIATWGKEAKTLGDGDAIKPWPVLLLNGTNVETGRRVVTTNVDAVAPAHRPTPTKSRNRTNPNAPLPCVAALSAYGQDPGVRKRLADCSVWEEPAVDDPFTTLQADMPVSTAVNMSARFPVVQPAGGISSRDGKRAYHVVDGGIYENFGAQTINDLLRHFLVVRTQAEHNADRKREWGEFARIRPMVVLISTDHDLDGVRQVAAAYDGDDDRVDGRMGARRNPVLERSMRLGCHPSGTSKDIPLCAPRLMKSANEVLGDAAALYRTRSGRGESGIQSLRETLASTKFYDENFFHFRQCMNGTLRPASMTWYVSGISRIFMSDLLPSTTHPHSEVDLKKLNFDQTMAFLQKTAAGTPDDPIDPCQNQVELKRFLDRYGRIRIGER